MHNLSSEGERSVFLHQETFKVLVYLDIYGQVIISLILVDKCIYSIVCLKS